MKIEYNIASSTGFFKVPYLPVLFATEAVYQCHQHNKSI